MDLDSSGVDPELLDDAEILLRELIAKRDAAKQQREEEEQQRKQKQLEEEAAKLIQDSKLLEQAGCFSIVYEKIPAELAAAASKSLTIPTIGIEIRPSANSSASSLNPSSSAPIMRAVGVVKSTSRKSTASGPGCAASTRKLRLFNSLIAASVVRCLTSRTHLAVPAEVCG